MNRKISCKQAVNYISKKEEGKLQPNQRFALWKHLSECSLCRNFSSQNKVIIKAMSAQEVKSLTPEEKETIITSVLESGR